MDSGAARKILSELPSIDEVLKSPAGIIWLSEFKRKIVLQGIREIISTRRKDILDGRSVDISAESLERDIYRKIKCLSSYSLIPVVNATGIVIHTNLGRAALSPKALENVLEAGKGYSNLEYDLAEGRRGKRHVHTKGLLKDLTGAEDAFIVNNNAAAVLLCLNTIARGREVIVSRGELVEIGGSFRVPDVMAASGAILREVGTTNKTHLDDYADAVNENTALILKVHQSNYRIIGFSEDVAIRELVSLGKQRQVPVMYDLGSGCFVDLKPYGIYSEPSVQEIISADIDLVSFSGDKLFGGPQGGIIAGKKSYIERIQKNPLARALRIDKLTIAAFEATLMDYLDTEAAKKSIPVLSMLFQPVDEIRIRARKIASKLRKAVVDGSRSGAAEVIEVVEEISKAGGGSLPEATFPTFAVKIKPASMSVNELESRLRKRPVPVIGRISDDALLLDARTIKDQEVEIVVSAVAFSLAESK